ncbi:MAG: radical SAM protein [Candidatus Schekmanbacteria bacterium]|nr:MAG: radical SAM protein [Candidatus Schekmanbacteria bacterium]
MEHYDLLGLELGLNDSGLVEGKVTGFLANELSGFFDLYLMKLNTNKVLAVKRGGNVYTCFLPPLPSKAGVKDLTRKLLRKFLNFRIPSTCTLSTTYACQAKCVHCSADKNMKKRGRELTTEEFKNVLDQAIELGVVNITLTGGEPLLRKDIFELIKHVNPDDANCMMFSNGEYLTEENCAKLAEAGLFSVMVSIDSPDPEIHDKYRGVKGLFDKAIKGIERAKKAGILVGISTYATREDYKDGSLERILELGKEIGVHEVVVFDPVPTGKLIDNMDMILSMEEKEEIAKLTNEYRMRPDYPGVITQSWINGPKGSGCFAGNEQFYMTAYGDICPCDFTPLSFGNIKDESLATIWNRILDHPAYREKCNHCRMQDKEFRAKYIDTIPENVPFPYEIFKENQV